MIARNGIAKCSIKMKRKWNEIKTFQEKSFAFHRPKSRLFILLKIQLDGKVLKM